MQDPVGPSDGVLSIWCEGTIMVSRNRQVVRWMFDGACVAIGSLEILFCVFVAAVAAGLYWLLVVLLGRSGSNAVRRDGLVLFGLPVLCVVAAALTPPDMVSLMFLAIPLCGLYSLVVGIWLLIRYRKPRRES